jgi:peptide/nickel transport system permease protein
MSIRASAIEASGRPELETPARPSRLRRLLRVRRTLLVGATVMAVIAAAAVLAPQVAPHDPLKADVRARLRAPEAGHPLGTDPLGRDILSRLIYGARISLAVSGLAVAAGGVVGVGLGLWAGYQGGLVDHLITRVADAALSFPGLLLALFLVALFGASLINVVAALAFVYAPQFALVVRARALTIREQEFILGAVALGAARGRILGRHILPNVATVALVQATLCLGGAMLTESSLSFLGLGIPPPAASWGSMLKAGYAYLELAPWIALAPAVAIFVAVLGLNLLGSGLSDILDPRAT